MPTNAEIIRAHYDGFANGDVETALAALASDIVWREADGFALAGTYVGRDTVVQSVLTPLQRDYVDFAFVDDELLESGDTVVAIGTYTGAYRATGRTFSARAVHIWRVRDGVAVRFEQIADTAVLAAAID